MRVWTAAVAATFCGLGALSCAGNDRGASSADGVAPRPLEVSACAEVQVFPAVEGKVASAGEVMRFRAQPGATVRLSRTTLTHEVRLPPGSTIGRSRQGNDYEAEIISLASADRSESFDSARHVIHCLAQRSD